MDLRFRSTKLLKYAYRIFFGVLADFSFADDISDLAQCASMGMLVMMRIIMMVVRMTVIVELTRIPGRIFLSVDKNIDFGRGDPAAVYARNLQRRTKIQSCDYLLKHCWRNSGIYQRTEEHVTADAGEAV